MDQKKFKAEYAKSGRSSCKLCKSTIAEGELRIALMVQSPRFDGFETVWHHVNCFFLRAKPQSTEDIDKFQNLRWNDQEDLRKRIENQSNDVPVPEPKTKGKAKGKKRAGNDIAHGNNLSDYTIEYAKSNRSKCKVCEEMITKGEVRISKKDYESETALRYGPHERWHHIDCFVKAREELKFFLCGSELPGFNTLEPDDKTTIKNKIPKMNSDVADGAPSPKKVKEEEDPADAKIMKKQNEDMFKIRDKLESLEKRELILLLETNHLKIPSGNDRILDKLADSMTFGIPASCTECKGQLTFKSGRGYACTGNTSSWTKCTAVYENPKRKAFKVPKELKDEYGFLKSFKSKTQDRIFKKDAQPSTSFENITPKNEKPLSKIIFFSYKCSLNDLEKVVEDLGGNVIKKFNKDVAAVITGLDKINETKLPKPLKTAEESGVGVYSENVFTKLSSASSRDDIVEAFKNAKVSTFGAIDLSKAWSSVDTVDSKSSIPTKSVYPSKTKSLFKSDISTKKLTVKDGLIVDPDSELADKAHVYKCGNDVYSCVLSLTDIQTQRNSFYKMQVLEADNKKKYWLFRAWGRIGTTIGGNKTQSYSSADGAIKEFEALFEEKTGNMWSMRKHFEKVPNKMMMLDLEDGSQTNLTQELSTDQKSKLSEPVQQLIKLLFDVDAMKRTMLEFELDLNKMPLGKITAKQINKAFALLSELQNFNKSAKVQQNLIIDHTNQFYTLVPHDFGVNNAPLLNNDEIINQKVDMLNNLLDIEIAYNLMSIKSEDASDEKSPIDAHYEKLKTNIVVLETDTDEFKMIEKYVKNTHAKTHSNYSLKIIQIFKIEREGEYSRYKPFEKLDNKMLLWHGSRITNFAGILSQGLRIAPPEAPATGYMFGKGIYFADMVSKSANYCMTSKANPTGLLLLCEVALGKMHELDHADYVTKLPTGKHSVKGRGKTHPDETDIGKTPSGALVPYGKSKDTKKSGGALLYNEYIVYDVKQVNIKYLVQMHFNFV